MIAFELDHAKDMKNPEYAYQFGRNERELEIIKLLENQAWQDEFGDWIIHEDKEMIIALIKGEK